MTWSRHSRRTLPINRSQVAFISGARIAVLRTRIPEPFATRSKSWPNLASRSRMMNSGAAPNGVTSDTDAELQELAADPFCAPGAVVGGHAANELYGVRCEAGLPQRRSLRLAPPEQTKAFAMPAEDGLRFNEEDGVSPIAKPAGEHDEQGALPCADNRSLHRARGDDELLAERSVLGHQLVAGTEEVSNEIGRERRWAGCVASRRGNRG